MAPPTDNSAILWNPYEPHSRYAVAGIFAPQNLPRMEADLLAMAPKLVSLELPAATRQAEDLVRSYDPCISCATHFLSLRVEERSSE